MKKLLTGLCIISTIGLSDIHAQNEKEIWRNDPTYSANNYKHPNKAAAVKQNKTAPATNFVTLNKAGYGVHTSRIVVPARRIFATDKTSNNKSKTPLAIRRKSSEKLPDYMGGTDNNEPQIDE